MKAEPSRKSHYKQMYRSAWENLPEFKGWLKGVNREPSKAICLYCKKILHAHRLSLLKHTCTLKHQKATELIQNNEFVDETETIISDPFEQEEIQENCHEEKEIATEIREIINITDHNIIKNVYQEQEYLIKETAIHMSDEVEEIYLECDSDQEQEQEQIKPNIITMQENVTKDPLIDPEVERTSEKLKMSKSPISSHILDTSLGKPADNVEIILYKLIDSRWTLVSEGVTNTDGRCSSFLERSAFEVGRYKLHFEVGKYFTTTGINSLYPFIEIVFDCLNAEEHYHIPLLLNPFGYTTYRGS